MFCKNCGKELTPQQIACEDCGAPKGQGERFCANCGYELPPAAVVCGRCGCPTSNAPQFNPAEQKSKLVAGLLGMFLGGWGVHNFYLGFTGKAIAQIILNICCCGVGSIWGFVEGIMILCGSISKDAKGIPLKD